MISYKLYDPVGLVSDLIRLPWTRKVKELSNKKRKTMAIRDAYESWFVSPYLAVSCRKAFRNVSGWNSSERSRVSESKVCFSALVTQFCKREKQCPSAGKFVICCKFNAGLHAFLHTWAP